MNSTIGSWRKSRHSQNTDNCVEVAGFVTTWAVRDTKDRSGGTVQMSPVAWQAFLATLR